MTVDFDALTLPELQRRRSLKWRTHPPDVLPLWVAELDVPIAPAVLAVLRAAVETGDTGYAEPSDLGRAFAGFAARRWGWRVEPARCWPVSDVMTGVAEALRVLTAPGDGVVICPPVYPPFTTITTQADRPPVPVPLTPGGALDLDAIDAALAAGARAVLLSSPHNPTGRVWAPAELTALDAVVAPHGAVVVSDEVHGPLTLPGTTFTPYLQAGDRHAVAVVSASKAFNLPGLKAALVVAGSPAVQERLATLPVEVAHRTGHLGVLAGIAAYDEGEPWLDGLVAHLDRNRTLLGELLADQLPQVGYRPPQASYLAFLDCRALGPRPAAQLLERTRVALVEGEEFGLPGAGFARLNFGTTRGVLEAAVRRMSAADWPASARGGTRTPTPEGDGT